MDRIGKVSFNPKGCVNMTKDEFKARLRHVNAKLVESAWKELQKEVKQFRPIEAPKPKRVKQKDAKDTKED